MAQYLILIYETEASYAEGGADVWEEVGKAHTRFAEQVGELCIRRSRESGAVCVRRMPKSLLDRLRR